MVQLTPEEKKKFIEFLSWGIEGREQMVAALSKGSLISEDVQKEIKRRNAERLAMIVVRMLVTHQA